MTDMSNFRALRQRVGLTIEEIAKETGFSPRTVYRWESGVRAVAKLLEPHISASKTDRVTLEEEALAAYG